MPEPDADLLSRRSECLAGLRWILLGEGVKAQFDPKRPLKPGRMYEGV